MVVPDCSCCSEGLWMNFMVKGESAVSVTLKYAALFDFPSFLKQYRLVNRYITVWYHSRVATLIFSSTPLPWPKEKWKIVEKWFFISHSPWSIINLCIVSLSRFYSLLTMMERRIFRFHGEQMKENSTKLNALGVCSLSWINIFLGRMTRPRDSSSSVLTRRDRNLFNVYLHVRFSSVYQTNSNEGRNSFPKTVDVRSPRDNKKPRLMASLLPPPSRQSQSPRADNQLHRNSVYFKSIRQMNLRVFILA